MKKIIVLLFFLTIGQISFSAIPNSTFFVGGKVLNKSFKITDKSHSSEKKNSFDGTTLALSVGVRGDYIRAFFDYMPESEYKSGDTDTKFKLSSYAINVEGFKSFDLLYLAGGVHAENITLKTKTSSEYPSGFVYGVNAAFGLFIGRFSGEFIIGATILGTEREKVKYDSATYQGIGIHYHI